MKLTEQQLADRNALAILRKYPTADIVNWGKHTGPNFIISKFQTKRLGGDCLTEMVKGRIKHSFETQRF